MNHFLSVSRPLSAGAKLFLPGLRRAARPCPFCALLLVLVLLSRFPASAATKADGAAPIESLAALQERISNHIHQAKFATALWGVKVVSLESGRTLFEHNASQYFIPASNTKLFTGALALDRLGADARIRTSLYAAARPDAKGLLAGDLMIYGRGDPSFSSHGHREDARWAIQRLVEALAEAGVKQIEGDLVADESFFRTDPVGAGWSVDDLEASYSAEVSALSINNNVLEVIVKPGATLGSPCVIRLNPPTDYLSISNRTVTSTNGARQSLSLHRPLGENVLFVEGQEPLNGSGFTDLVAVHRPAGLFLRWFQEALAERGIGIGRGTRVVNWRQRAVEPLDLTRQVELGFVESPTVAELVHDMEKLSQNLHAHLLLLQVGARSRQKEADAVGTDEAGIAELRLMLSAAGIGPRSVLFEEGSGLSRRHLVTPNAVTGLLRWMSRHRFGRDFEEALPIAGVDGTLKNRMTGTAAVGNVHAKTGTLRYVNSLSGYVNSARGERLAFSILLNNYNGGSAARDELDAVAILLAGFAG